VEADAKRRRLVRQRDRLGKTRFVHHQARRGEYALPMRGHDGGVHRR
jgi:hypothetical protein